MNNAYYVHDTLPGGKVPFFHQRNHQQSRAGFALLAGSDSYSNLLSLFENDNNSVDNQDEDIMSLRNNMMIIKTRLRKFQSSSRALKRKEKSTWSLDTEPSTVAESRWSSNDSIDCVGQGGSSGGTIPEPVCVDEYLPIETSCTEIEWEPIQEQNAKDEEQDEREVDAVEFQDHDDDYDDDFHNQIHQNLNPSLEEKVQSPQKNARMDRVETIVQQLLQRQDEICIYMNETLNHASETAEKMHQKPSALMRSINKAHDLVEQQKRISILFAESVKRFAKQLDKKVKDSKGKSKEIKRLKADLAETKQALSELVAGSPRQTQYALMQRYASDPSLLNKDDEQSMRKQLEILTCINHEKEDELSQAKAAIEDLVEQLREAEDEIEYCVQRERESAMAMQAVLNCKIADQRCEIDELTEQLEHKTTALVEAEARCKLMQQRLQHRASKRVGLKEDAEEVDSCCTAEFSESQRRLNALRARRIDLEALVAFGRRNNIWLRRQDDDDDDDVSVAHSVQTAV